MESNIKFQTSSSTYEHIGGNNFKLKTMEKKNKKYDCANTYDFRKGFEEGYNKAKENEQNQLEIPTDEEIYELAEKRLLVDYLSFTEGAKWMRDKIKGGNNE